MKGKEGNKWMFMYNSFNYIKIKNFYMQNIQ